jgi:hypothetical protein
VSFRLLKKSAVIVGTFNIYIIQPAWLREVGLAGDDVEGVMLETDLSQPGFKMHLPGVVWRVEPTRLTLETDSSGHNLGATLATVLEKLPWTPLLAMGFNAEYEVERSGFDAAGRWPHPATDADMGGEAALVSIGWGAAVTEGDQRYNLSLYSRGDKFRLSSNVHTELGGQKIDFAKAAAMKYFCCQQKAASFAALLYQVTIDDI